MGKSVERLPVPEWSNKPYEQWPTEARTYYGILTTWAMRDAEAKNGHAQNNACDCD